MWGQSLKTVCGEGGLVSLSNCPIMFGHLTLIREAQMLLLIITASYLCACCSSEMACESEWQCAHWGFSPHFQKVLNPADVEAELYSQLTPECTSTSAHCIQAHFYCIWGCLLSAGGTQMNHVFMSLGVGLLCLGLQIQLLMDYERSILSYLYWHLFTLS